MDYNLETWKGSCGYSAPGRIGIQGNNGNSIHFSSIDVSINANIIKERIRNNQSLSNNTEAISDEKYKINDYILDTYGQLFEITNIYGNIITLDSLGNIAFQDSATQGYEVPSNSHNTTELKFKVENNLTYPPYTNNALENAYSQRGTIDALAWGELKLWRYRYFGRKTYGGSLNFPTGYYVVPDPSTYTLTGKDDNGETLTFSDSKNFIEYIASSEEYCKICAVLNNGLVIESIPSSSNGWGIFVEKGYIESIDKNITTLKEYETFKDELDASLNTSTIKNSLKTGYSVSMCHMYFEYSHNGEIYRMNINVS